MSGSKHIVAKGETTRRKLIGHATLLIYEKGYNSTSVQDVINAVGLKKGSFYFHFASKEELGYAVIENASTQILERMNAVIKQDDLTPREKLEAMLEEVQVIVEDADCARGCILGNLTLELSHQHEGFRKKLAEVFSDWSSQFEVVLTDMKLSGDLPEDFDCPTYADFIISALEGGIMLSKVTLDPSPMRNAIALITGQIEDVSTVPQNVK